MTPYQIEIIKQLHYCGAALSAIASFSVLICYWRSSFFRKHVTFKIVICVAFSDLICSISGFLGDPHPESQLCIFQGFLMQFGIISSTLWIVTICWTITRLLKNESKDYLNSLFTTMNVVIWVSSGIISIIPFFTDSYGESGGHCWIKGDNDYDLILREFIHYVPIWISFGVVLYLCLEITVCNTNNVPIPGNIKFFPLIFVFCFIAGSIRRVWDWASINNTPFIVVAVHAATVSLLGFLDSMLLVLNKEFIKYVIGKCYHANDGTTTTEDISGETYDCTDIQMSVGNSGTSQYEHLSSIDHGRNLDIIENGNDSIDVIVEN